MFGFSKKNKNTADSSSVEQTAKPKKPADFRKMYPFLSKLKIPEVVPAKTLDTLKSLVQGDDKERGAVREASDKSGYLVAMISEEQLINVGFDSKNAKTSAGQFAQAIKHRSVLSATLRNDLNEGYITIIPNSKSLQYLESIPECTELKYQLALFPAAINDADALSCEPLKFVGDTNNKEGLVSLGDLLNFSDKGTELVIDREAHTVSTEEYIETLNQSDEKDDPAGELSNDGQLTGYDASTVTPDDDEDLDVVEESDDTPDTFDDIQDADIDDVPYEDDEDTLADLDDVDSDVELTEDDEEAMNRLDELSEDVPDENDEFKSEDAKLYADALKDLANQEVEISSDLGLNASANDISVIYDETNIPQLELVDAGDNELQARLNTLRSALNANLARVLVDKRKHRISEYSEQLASLVKEIEEKVSVESNDEYKAEFEALKSDYDEAVSKVETDIKNRQSKLVQQYDKDKDSYVDAASKQAAVEYDTNNKAILNQRIKAVEDDLSGKPSIAYNQGILALNQRRRESAQALFNTAKLDILSKLREEFAQDDAEIHKMYDDFKAEVDAKLNESYAQELKRADNLKDVAEHDDTVNKLTKQLEDAKAQNKVDVENAEREVTETMNRALHNRDDEIKHLKETIQNIKANNEASVSRIRADYESGLSNAQKSLDTLQKQYHEKLEQSQLDYDRYSTTNRNKLILMIVFTAVFVLAAFSLGALWGGSGKNTTTQTNGTNQAPTYVIPGVTQSTQSSSSNSSSDSNSNTNNNNSSNNQSKSNTNKSSDNVDKH